MTEGADTAAKTIDELAKALRPRVSSRTLKSWIARGCPRTSVEAITAWRLKHVLPRKGGPRKPRSADEVAESNEYQARRVIAEAEKAEEAARKAKRDNAIADGKLVPRDDITRQWALEFAPARTLIDTFPDQLAKEAPRELRIIAYEFARNMADKLLRGLARISTDGPASDAAR